MPQEATTLRPPQGGRTSGGHWSQFSWRRNRMEARLWMQQGSKWRVSQTVSSCGREDVWLIHRSPGSSWGGRWAPGKAHSGSCRKMSQHRLSEEHRGCGWSCRLSHWSLLWGSQDLLPRNYPLQFSKHCPTFPRTQLAFGADVDGEVLLEWLMAQECARKWSHTRGRIRQSDITVAQERKGPFTADRCVTFAAQRFINNHLAPKHSYLPIK